MLPVEDEAIIVAFRRHTLLPLDNLPVCPAGYPSALDPLVTVSLPNGIHFTTPGDICSAAADIRVAIDAGEIFRAHAFECACARNYIDNHEQLRSPLACFVTAYDFAQRLKTLKGITPYEFICRTWTNDPRRLAVDPIHQMPRLNI